MSVLSEPLPSLARFRGGRSHIPSGREWKDLPREGVISEDVKNKVSELVEADRSDARPSIERQEGLRALANGKTFFFDTAEDKFKWLADRWTSERGPESSIARIAMNFAYQQIVGMGEAVVPFILQELSRKPDHWFWALNAITGDDPIPESSRGIMRDMVRAWLDWGEKNGYRQGQEKDQRMVPGAGGGGV